GEDRNDRAIHGHGNRDLFERDTVEQDFHVLNRVDRNARLANVTFHARMIAVIAAMGGKVESNRDALLACGQRLAIEGVRLFSRGEPSILADGPWAARIHGGARATHERLVARQRIQMVDTLQVFRRIERLDRNVLGRVPDDGIRRTLELLLRQLAPLLNLWSHFCCLLSYSPAIRLKAG